MQLRHPNATTLRRPMISIPPLRFQKLRAVHDDLVELHARLGAVHVRRDHVDARAEPKHEPRVMPVQHEVAASEQHLAWCGDGGRSVGRRHGFPLFS